MNRLSQNFIDGTFSVVHPMGDGEEYPASDYPLLRKVLVHAVETGQRVLPGLIIRGVVVNDLDSYSPLTAQVLLNGNVALYDDNVLAELDLESSAS